MANVNKVILIGNLTRDPELRVTPKGTPVCQFGLAINRQFKDEATGQMREEVTFVDLEAWGRQAETIAKYCTKGRPLYVEGRLKYDQWDDKTSGQKRSKLKIVLENFQFLGSRSDQPGAPGGGGAPGSGGGPSGGDEGIDQTVERPAPAPRPAARPPAPPAGMDDEVPF